MEKSLICGVGINDADYDTKSCPIYSCWKSLIRRVFSLDFQEKNPTYEGCTIEHSWIRFSEFHSWAKTKNYQGNQIDKDLLTRGNRHYGPNTCVFVSHAVNSFLTERANSRGDWPIGVYFHKASGKFMARCNDCVDQKRLYLGIFDTPEEAHQEWLTEKKKQAKILASQQTDPRVAKALIERYENYEQ